MVEAGLLTKYVEQTATGKLVSSAAAKNALGVDVAGYVIPMFHSQTAWAYNPDLVASPPQSYAELQAWVKDHPKAFGYNGIRNGMSGISFVTGWMYSETGEGEIAALDLPRRLPGARTAHPQRSTPHRPHREGVTPCRRKSSSVRSRTSTSGPWVTSTMGRRR